MNQYKITIQLNAVTDMSKEQLEAFIRDLLNDYQGTTYNSHIVSLQLELFN